VTIVRSKAPLRISFGGGGTDVSPYPEEKGGAVLSATIDRYAYCSLATKRGHTANVYSLDYDLVAKYSPDEKPQYNGELGLVKAAIRVMGTGEGVDLFLHSDAPPGSGLGTSSAMTVAIVGAFNFWQKKPVTDYETAELAYRIEREEAGIKGGKQDQYAATFGGFNFIEFLGKTTIVNPLRIKPEIINELQYRLLLCYTGQTRLSAGIIEDQVSGYIKKNYDVTQALDQTKALALEMKNKLLLGKVDEFGELMHEAWEHKKKFSSMMTDRHIDELYEEARKNGALGGKLLGAGGGGYLLLLSEFDKWHIIAKRLEDLGGKVVKFSFSSNGLQTWGVNGD
jgi:D-glycero-alpha-D-manno-heptose-7-phosphate kinase